MHEEMFDSTGPAVTLTGNVQDNIIYAGGGNTTLLGGDGNDSLIGFWGNDLLNGGNGDDILVGDKGTDLFIGGAGNDSMSGGQGIDTVSYAGSPAGIVLTMSKGTAQDGFGNTDTLSSIENVIGSPFADTIVASNVANVLTGGDGDDRITAKNGDDTLNGGNGSDRLDGGDGNDIITGGAGNDRITGGLGQDTIVPGPGHDIIVYTAAAESTGPGYDIIQSFDAATDRIQLPEVVTGTDPIIVGGSLTHATFDVDLAALVGPDQLEVAHFVLVTADTGDLAGHTFLVIDANGEAGYQAGEDYVIELSAAKGGLSTWNFIAV
jgi:Ca2+-binding RTX toxin-like protein